MSHSQYVKSREINPHAKEAWKVTKSGVKGMTIRLGVVYIACQVERYVYLYHSCVAFKGTAMGNTHVLYTIRNSACWYSTLRPLQH